MIVPSWFLFHLYGFSYEPSSDHFGRKLLGIHCNELFHALERHRGPWTGDDAAIGRDDGGEYRAFDLIVAMLSTKGPEAAPEPSAETAKSAP